MPDLVDRPATDQLNELDERTVSAVELLDAHLARIDAVNGDVNAVVSLDPELARGRAADVDRRRVAGDALGPLAGLVTAHKDLLDTVDFPTTYGSPVYRSHRPAADALLAARVKEADAVAIGKTNTPEFGAGSHTFNPVHGLTRNPWDLDRSAGGSSGGAAAALACGMVSIADGSDMGGSLRNPAAWNSVVGFRGSPGLVPSVGPGVARASFGVEGAMGRTVADLALLLSVISLPDARDPLRALAPVPSSLIPVERPLRVAFSPTLGGLPVEDDVATVVAEAVGRVHSIGWHVEMAEPDLRGADECFATIRSYLFGAGVGATIGDRVTDVKPTVQEEVARAAAQSGAEVAAAHVELGRLWREAVRFFSDIDLLLAPVTQCSPFPADQEYPTSVADVPCERYIDWMRSCCRITALGMPALSLPVGFTEAGLPVGLQLVGGPRADVEVLSAAMALEALLAIDARPPILAG